ncbi:MAG: hypothetical protein HKP25_15315 [Marinicaulis sp.]|nr:hypothetical protein [Marinicaulis sp.]
MIRLAVFILVFFCVVPAQAEIIVSSNNDLINAVDKAKKYETIIVEAGAYRVSDLKLRRHVNLVGRGRVVFSSDAPVAKGLLNPLPGIDLRVENIIFRGAVSPDKNGAGIRHDGRNLTIVDCVFEDNENGVLATGDKDGVIEISGAKFLRNGHGDGYSHGIYVLRATSLTIENSEFIGTRIGHHVKTLADKSVISETIFDDADGRTSYAVDASRGGDVAIYDNEIRQASNSDNNTIINYDLTRGGKATALRITGNKVVNGNPRGRLLRNATDIAATVANNEISNEGRGRLEFSETDETITPKPELDASNSAKDSPTGPLSHPKTSDTAPDPSVVAIEQRADKKLEQKFVLRAPNFVDAPGAIVRFKLQNNWKVDAGEDYFTFGQAFVEGDVPANAQLTACFGDTETPAQLDVKALHGDGSVRHAAITIAIPPIKSGKTIDGALYLGEAEPFGDFDAIELIAKRYALPVALRFYFADGGVQDAFANPRALQRKDATDVWFSGPLVKEYRVEKEVAAHLKIRFDIRVYRDGDIRTSVAFINEKSFARGRRDMTYDVLIGGAFAHQKLGHHRASNWRRIVWTGDQPKVHIFQDAEYLARANAAPPLDYSRGINAEIVSIRDDALAGVPPLSPALLQKYFPTTGARGDIGIVPQWISHFLLAQTEAAKRVMLANAEAAGAVPWHFADDETGAPISIDHYPKFWSDQRGTQSKYGADRPHPDIFDSRDGGWSIDHAHKPALIAIPYLVTADRYYADELAMQAAFSIFGRWPDLREGGVKAIDIEQVRASAWSLRDLSDAAFLLPDAHPSKNYLKSALQRNLAMMVDKYIASRSMKSAGELEGFFEEYVGRDPERISAWQNDFLVISLWQAARRGSEDAKKLLNWTLPFQTGRILNRDFDHRFATAYSLPIKDAQTQTPVASWAGLAVKIRSSGASTPDGFEGYKDTANGYIASALGALTGLASSTGSPSAYDALGFMLNETKGYPLWSDIAKGGVKVNNNYIFQLSLPSGAALTQKDIRWQKNGSDNSDLIIGDNGANKIDAGGGDDAIIGGDGDDDLSGGDGNDFISAGRGDNVLSGGDGDDIFGFTKNSNGENRISDFEPAQDKIVISMLSFDDAFSLSKHIRSIPDGAVIDFENTAGSIFLQNVDAAHLNQDNIKFVH